MALGQSSWDGVELCLYDHLGKVTEIRVFPGTLNQIQVLIGNQYQKALILFKLAFSFSL